MSRDDHAVQLIIDSIYLRIVYAPKVYTIYELIKFERGQNEDKRYYSAHSIAKRVSFGT